MYTFLDLMLIAIEKRASDLHLSPGRAACARVDGDLVPIVDKVLKPDEIKRIAESIMEPRHIDILKEKGEVDFAFSEPSVGRFRINVFFQRGSHALVARLLNNRIPTPDELSIPEAVRKMCYKKRGIVLVTGPTGSGKSTTLASLINVINTEHKRHIITLEDPIEYLHTHKSSMVNQREVGSDTNSFPNALRAALRQDPDVILVGEMRDLETISIAVTAAETGHLVFSTLHTVGAANTIDRIIDVFPAYQQQQIRTQLADVLECVVSQQLVPVDTGYGRVAAFEVMVSNSAIRNNIREGKTFQIPSAMLTNQKVGMKTMDDALMDLYIKGVISKESVIAFAQDIVAVKKRLF